MIRLLLLIGVLLPCFAQAAEKIQPRILIGLYDTREESTPRTSQIHRFLEMPANHLGYDIHYYDIDAPLPVLGDDIAGIVAWFNIGVEVPDAEVYLRWLQEAQAHGKKLIIVENGGIGDNYRKQPQIVQRWNHVLAHIGLRDDNSWNEMTYRAALDYIDKDMVGFERKVGPVLPALSGMHVIPGMAVSHLRARYINAGQDDTYDLVATDPNGGYVAQGYALYHEEDPEKSDVNQWYINPFNFLRKSLDTGLSPIPDVTTLDGRRIFYSHIDGDGWNNISEIQEYANKNVLSAEAIYNEILKPYSDFAFDVGLITADIEPGCYGVPDSERVARAIFALPNVEPSSHTHTHPLFWQFFAQYSPEKEKPLLDHYPPKPGQTSSLVETIKQSTAANPWAGVSITAAPTAPVKRGRNEESVDDILKKYFSVPRSYACRPFDINDEIAGSIKTINTLIPPDKKVRLIQWSGDTSPFEAALAKARESGVYNINGGDSRFDNEYPSYSSVSPIGLKVGNERQIFSSNSNENTYTNLWTSRFFGYRYLQNTVLNTENPIRVRPFNLYFHIFSGEKRASINAVKENLEFARSQPIIPITASEYAAIADGFYSAVISKIGENSWHIHNRGGLQNFRFDNAAALSVDFNTSQGVIGQHYFQGSLYVACDPEQNEIVISLKNNNNINILPKASNPYLIESTWEINHLQNSKSLLTFVSQGYGHGVMRWQMPAPGEYIIRIQAQGGTSFEKHVTVAEDGILSFTIDEITAILPVTVNISTLQK